MRRPLCRKRVSQQKPNSSEEIVIPTEIPISSPTATPTPKLTALQEMAIGEAKKWIDGAHVSRKALIEFLEMQNFTYSEAVFAADNCGADWKEEAFQTLEVLGKYLVYTRETAKERLMNEITILPEEVNNVLQKRNIEWVLEKTWLWRVKSLPESFFIRRVMKNQMPL